MPFQGVVAIPECGCHPRVNPLVHCWQVENKNMMLLREKADMQSQLEENEEDMSELMKKFKAAVQQVAHRLNVARVSHSHTERKYCCG